ncbi:MAG: hypothetical protein R3B90_15680 [Planctomycetaceae bacterium]
MLTGKSISWVIAAAGLLVGGELACAQSSFRALRNTPATTTRASSAPHLDTAAAASAQPSQPSRIEAGASASNRHDSAEAAHSDDGNPNARLLTPASLVAVTDETTEYGAEDIAVPGPPAEDINLPVAHESFSGLFDADVPLEQFGMLSGNATVFDAMPDELDTSSFRAMHPAGDTAHCSALSQGRLYLESGNPVAAQACLEQVYATQGNLPDVAYYLGQAYLANGYPVSALEVLESGCSSSWEMDHLRRLARASAYNQIGLYNYSAEVIDEVEQCGTSPAVRAEACRLRHEINTSINREKPLYGSLRYGLRYDTNPGVVSTSNVFGVVNRRRPSVANAYDAGFNYELYRGEATTITAGYNIFATNNYPDHASDQLDNAGYIAMSRGVERRNMPVILSVRLDYDHLQVGSDPFVQRFRFDRSITVLNSDVMSTRFHYRFTRFDFLRQGVFEGTPLDIDSGNHMLGVARQWEFPVEGLIVTASYDADYNNSQGDNVDYWGHQVRGSMNYLIPGTRNVEFEASGGLHFRDFVNRDLLAGYERNDVEYIASLKLLYQFQPDWYLSCGYSMNRNDSNITASDYDRDLVEVAVQYNFPAGGVQNRLLRQWRD